MDLWTAQLRYGGPDRLDITVQGKDPVGSIFAPTWDMVRRYKEAVKLNKVVEAIETYTTAYWTLMDYRLPNAGSTVSWILSRKEVTFVCFCPAGAFCHRVLISNLLDKNVPDIHYRGERKL